MITLYNELKNLGTVVVTSCESKRSGYVSQKFKSYLQAGICQNCLSALASHMKKPKTKQKIWKKPHTVFSNTSDL